MLITLELNIGAAESLDMEPLYSRRFHDFTVSSIDTTYVCSSWPHIRESRRQTPFVAKQISVSQSIESIKGPEIRTSESCETVLVNNPRYAHSNSKDQCSSGQDSKFSIPRLSFSCLAPECISSDEEPVPPIIEPMKLNQCWQSQSCVELPGTFDSLEWPRHCTGVHICPDLDLTFLVHVNKNWRDFLKFELQFWTNSTQKFLCRALFRRVVFIAAKL